MSRQIPLATVFAIALVALLLTAAPSFAAIITYNTHMDGPTEGTPSNGTGDSVVTYDNVAHTMRVQASFTGLTGTTTASHIHAPTPAQGSGTASVATQTPTFSSLPLGVTSGSFDQTLDLTQAGSWNPSYISANGGTPASAENAFFRAMDGNKAYLNIHSSVNPGGEIRGFYVPEPGAMTLLGAGAIVGIIRRRRAI
jgi:hypothetical protein